MYKIDVKKLVDAKFKNLNQFAMECKMQRAGVDKVYQGTTTRISLDVLEAICDVLDCTPNDILAKYIDDEWIPISKITPEQKKKMNKNQKELDCSTESSQRRFKESLNELDKKTLIDILSYAYDRAEDFYSKNNKSNNNQSDLDSGDAK